MGATTSRGNQVLNVMAYKRRDALRYILREYDALRRLVQVVDVQMPQVSNKKKWNHWKHIMSWRIANLNWLFHSVWFLKLFLLALYQFYI